MTIAEVKKGLLSAMKTAFPASRWKYYGMDVIEGFERPCFFTQIKPVDTSPANYNSRIMRATFYITVMQKEINEAEILDIIQKLQDIFGLSVQIGDRAVHIEGIDWDFIGTERNAPEISVDISWGVRINHETTESVMGSAEINTTMEG